MLAAAAAHDGPGLKITKIEQVFYCTGEIRLTLLLP